MSAQHTLRDLLAREQVFAPCIYDCLSAKAAELVGFKAMLLSSSALSWSMVGLPDIALLNVEETIQAADRIAAISPLPMIIDAEDGYGESPLNAYRTASRLARAGAMAVTIDDTTGIRGWERLQYGDPGKHRVVSAKLWLAKIQAALKALEGTGCMLIARTEAKLPYGIDEAISRCRRAAELGAEMTLICGIGGLEDCRRVAAEVPGWKMYPDIPSQDGKPIVPLDTLAALGFNLVTMHYLEKGAMYGMLEYGRHNFENQSAAYSDAHDMGGLTPQQQLDVMTMDYRKWAQFEQDCYQAGHIHPC